jgi:hypothetical protein
VVSALFVVGVFTSFHAAMRTFVSPMTIGLSMVYIKSVVNKQRPKNQVNQTVVRL